MRERRVRAPSPRSSPADSESNLYRDTNLYRETNLLSCHAHTHRCFHFLGMAHSREILRRKEASTDVCQKCGQKPDFVLRAASGAMSA